MAFPQARRLTPSDGIFNVHREDIFMEQNSRAGVDRIAVVIGAGTIGCAISRHLSNSGWVTENVGHESIELADPASVARCFAQWQKFDLLVNAAGSYGAIGKVEEVAPEQWLGALHVNLGGVYACIHHALPRLVAGGHIITLLGGGGGPVPHLSGYCAAKQGLARLMATVAVEHPEIHANSISPGPMMSGIQAPLLELSPERAGPAQVAIRQIRDTGIGAVPIENTLRVIDHILSTKPTGHWFTAREFGESLAVAA